MTNGPIRENERPLWQGDVPIIDWRNEATAVSATPAALNFASSISIRAFQQHLGGKRIAVGILDADELDGALDVPEGTAKALYSLGVGPGSTVGIDQEPRFLMMDVGSWLAVPENRQGLKALVAAIDRFQPGTFNEGRAFFQEEAE